MSEQPTCPSESVTIQVIGGILSRSERKVWEGWPGREVIDYLPAEVRYRPGLKILRNGVILDQEEAAHQIAVAGDTLTFYLCPGGVPQLIMLGISLVLSAILTGVSMALAPSAKPLENELESSPTYGFGGITSTVRPGTPIPVIYGEHRVGGHIIEQFQREARGDGADPKSGELHTLIALSTGPVESISSVRANESPIEEFGKIDDLVQTRTGELYQDPIEGFHDAVIQRAQERALEAVGDPLSYTTPDPIDAFELIIRFPGGLYSLSNTGQFRQRSVQLLVEYRETGAVSWQAIYRTISQKTQGIFDAFIVSPRLERAQYDIRVSRITPDDTSATGYSATTLLAVNEITAETLTYPRIALLAVRQLPTGQVSGSPPAYDCIVKGKRVRVFTSLTEHTIQWSDNPAWCLLDYLTDPFNGLGAWLDDSQIDLQSFLDWAAFCDELVPADERGVLEKRFRLDMVVDGWLSAIDVIQQMCVTGRANSFLRGDRWTIRIDQEEPAVQFFQMSRVRKGSFSVVKRSRMELANVFVGQFWNRDIEFQEDAFPHPDTVLQDGEEEREASINLLGTTRSSQAKRILNYLMLSNRLLRRDVELEAGTESIAMEAGDVFKVAHDVPGWGLSGRIFGVDETGTALTLDRDVTIEAGKEYELTVIHPATDAIDVVRVTSLPGVYRQVLVSGDWSTPPAAGLDYSFGEIARSTVLYRCLGITRSSDPTRRKIRAREYNAAVYGLDLSVLPTPSPSRLPDPGRIPGDPKDLRLVERQVYAEDGTLSTALDVHFTLPIEPGIGAMIFWRRLGDLYWEPASSRISGGYYSIIQDVESPGITYEVSVVSVSATGTRKSAEDGLRGQITTVGTTRQPDNVGGFVVDRTMGGLVFRWQAVDPVRNFDLDYYEVRDGGQWDTAALVGRTQNTTLETAIYVAGTRTFLLKAFNTAGKGSPAPAVVVMIVPDRIGENVVLVRQEDPTWGGSKAGFVVDSGDLLLDTQADIVAWRSTPTPMPGRSGLIPGGYGVSFRVTGVYMTDIFQVGADSVRCLVSTDIEIDQVDTTLYWASAELADKTWDSAFARSRTWGIVPDGRVETRVEMRFSTTTSADGAFGPWQERPQNIEVECKWAQIRVTATVKDPAYTVKIRRLRVYFDVPDITDSGVATSSDTALEGVLYVKTFLAAPKVTATVIGASAGDEVNILNITTAGFDVEVKNGGSRVVRTVHWHAHGY